MISAGIDIGFEATKAVIMQDGKILGRAVGFSGGRKRKENAEKVFEAALADAGIAREAVEKVFATGKGMDDAVFADDHYSVTVALARGAAALCPEATMLYSLGADETLAVVLGEGGKVAEYAINEKCMAGIGSLLKYLAIRLGLSREEMGSLEPTDIRVNDGCVVMADQDVLSLLNNGVEAKKIASAVTTAMAYRAANVYNEITLPAPEKVALAGGLAGNGAFVRELEKVLSLSFTVPEDYLYICAAGAALLAAD